MGASGDADSLGLLAEWMSALPGVGRAAQDEVPAVVAHWSARPGYGIFRPRFDFEFELNLANLPLFVNAAEAARRQYFYINTIREDWVDLTDDDPDALWADFARDELDRRPAEIPEDAAIALLALAETRSGPVSPEGDYTADPGQALSPGGSITGAVSFAVNIGPGWHVFSSVPDLSPHPVTSLTLQFPEGVEAIGDLEVPAPQPLAGQADTRVFGVLAVYRQRVRSRASSATLGASVHFQACKGAECQPPTTLAFNVVLLAPPPVVGLEAARLASPTTIRGCS